MRRETLEWVEIAEGDFSTASREAGVADQPNFAAVCFHAQQCAEKYLKAFLTEHGIQFPKTHDLERLLALVTSVNPEASFLRDAAQELTGYGMDVRYPSRTRAGSREATVALASCAEIRVEVQRLLGLREGSA